MVGYVENKISPKSYLHCKIFLLFIGYYNLGKMMWGLYLHVNSVQCILIPFQVTSKSEKNLALKELLDLSLVYIIMKSTKEPRTLAHAYAKLAHVHLITMWRPCHKWLNIENSLQFWQILLHAHTVVLQEACSAYQEHTSFAM